MKQEETKNLIESTADLDTTYLGTHTSSLGVEENFGMQDWKRLLHTLIVGPTGVGKTQSMIHTALQDAHKERGFAFVNPKGDAVDELLAKLPEDRLEDVVYVNPAWREPPGINVLEPHITEEMNEAQREHQKEIIVSDVIDLVKRQSENWGDRFPRILETLLRAHLDLNIYHRESTTLLDVFQCVINQDELVDLIDRTDDPVVREQLVRVKEDMGTYELEPLQRRLNDFVMNPTIRNVISAEESGVNFVEAVNQGQIVLIDIQKGEVGEIVSQLVGSIVITQVWAAAQSRITQAEEERKPFYLYVDELQNFAGEGSNFTTILSEAREYGLGCTLASQYLRQLAPEMRRAVINNCRTKIVFDPADSEDVNRIAGMLREVEKDSLQRLGSYRAAVQKPSDGQQYKAVILDTYPPWSNSRDDINEIKNQTAATATSQSTPSITSRALGKGKNGGGEHHAQLLKTGKQELENRGFQVDLLYQDTGDDKPDGLVHLPDQQVAHLEAEHTSPSKPGKVLKNLKRAAEHGNECIFLIQEDQGEKLENILEDPVNRQGNNQEDDQGSYSYYTLNGEPVIDTELLATADYRVIEIPEEQLQEDTEPECPELDDNSREDLQTFCLYREDDGFCIDLEQQCVLLEDS